MTFWPFDYHENARKVKARQSGRQYGTGRAILDNHPRHTHYRKEAIAVAADFRYATHDQAEIDRILKRVGEIYYRAIIGGRFDVEGYEREQAEKKARESAAGRSA